MQGKGLQLKNSKYSNDFTNRNTLILLHMNSYCPHRSYFFDFYKHQMNFKQLYFIYPSPSSASFDLCLLLSSFSVSCLIHNHGCKSYTVNFRVGSPHPLIKLSYYFRTPIYIKFYLFKLEIYIQSLASIKLNIAFISLDNYLNTLEKHDKFHNSVRSTCLLNCSLQILKCRY